MSKWQRVKKFFRDNFFSGLLVVIPAVASIYIFVQVLKWIYARVDFIKLNEEVLASWLESVVPAWSVKWVIDLIHVSEFLVLLFVLVVLTALIGLVTRFGIVRWVFSVAERVLEKIPFVGVLYSALKQLLEAIFSGKGSFSKVVMVEFPREGIWSVGFLSRESGADFESKSGAKNLYTIFIPTTPNPTNGFLVVVPEGSFIELDLSIDEAFKFIMSGGMILPHEEAEQVLKSNAPPGRPVERPDPQETEG